jgi:hypothetical protein
MLVEVMKFGISGFKQAKPIEGTLDAALDQLKEKQKQAAANPQPAPPNPEMMKIQATQQLEQAKMQASAQAEQMKMQAEAQALQMQAQIDDQKMRHEMEMKAQEVKSIDDFNRWKSELEAATKIMVARIGANPGVDLQTAEAAQAASDRVAQELGAGVSNALNQVTVLHADMANKHDESLQQVKQALSALMAPKRIVRGPDGRAVGVEIAQ